MNAIKSAISGIPPKQAGEEPATEKQTGYLRSFGFFSESTIHDLGIWQASYLIDKAISIREADDEVTQIRYSNKPRKRGCGCLLLTLVLLGVIVWGINRPEKSPVFDTNADNTVPPPPSRTAPQPHDPIPMGQVNLSDQDQAEQDEAVSKAFQKTVVPQPEELISLEASNFPLSVISIESFELLDKKGKETPIPIGSTILITNRTQGGTLTMDIRGVLFVGNESRMLGKIKLK